MPVPWVELEPFRILAEALGIGLLVGIERYYSRSEGEKRVAGIRTFGALGLLGGIAALLAHAIFTTAIFISLAALLVVGYYRRPAESIGGTTEITGLVVFWLGYLTRDFELLAIGAAIVLTVLLASKRSLHNFVRRTLSEDELFATLKLMVVVLVIYPLLPDAAMGPYEFFNPSTVWLLVVAVGTISFVGYVLMRWLGQSRGLGLSALLGGVVSTTATTMSLAMRSREAPQFSRQLAAAAVAANAVQFPRILVLVYLVDRELGYGLLLPCVGACTAGLTFAAWLARRTERDEQTIDLGVRNPFDFMPALKYAAFFVVVLFVLRVAEAWLGEGGVYLTSMLAGAANVSAVALSIAGLVSTGTLDAGAGVWVLLFAVGANALTKGLLALANGTRGFAGWLGGGLVTMLGLGLMLAWLI